MESVLLCFVCLVAFVSSQFPGTNTDSLICSHYCICTNNEILCNDGYRLDFSKLLQTSREVSTIKVYNFVITDLGFQFNAFHNLQNLEVTRSRVRRINEVVFHKLDELQILNLENNQISRLPENIFQDLRSLKSLNLGGNLLENLPEAIFSNLTHSLTHLSLHSNRLRFLKPKLFDSLTHLESLDMSNNELSYILPRTFSSLAQVRTINLDDNLLVTLHEDSFNSNNISTSTSLSISHNPLECNCGLAWLKLTLLGQGSGIELVNNSEIICASPMIYHNKHLSLVPLEQFNCTAPTVHSLDENTLHYHSNKVKLTCEVGGNPYPSVVWKTPLGDYISELNRGEWLDGSIATFSQNKVYRIYATGETISFTIRSGGGFSSLSIDGLHTVSSGNYQCIAMNPEGSASATFDVKLTSAIDRQYPASLVIGASTVVIGIIIGIIGCSITACVENCDCCLPCNKPITYYDGEEMNAEMNECAESCTETAAEGDKCNLTVDSSVPVSEINEQTALTAEEWNEYFREYPDDFVIESLDGISKSQNSPHGSPSHKGGRTLDTLEGVRVRLKLRVEQMDIMKERLRSRMEKRSARMKENIEKRKERMNKTMQNIKESTSQSLQSIRETGRNYSHKLHQGVRTAMENVGAHVQSLKEFCGTGDLGQTISVATIMTDVDTNEKTEVIRNITMV